MLRCECLFCSANFSFSLSGLYAAFRSHGNDRWHSLILESSHLQVFARSNFFENVEGRYWNFLLILVAPDRHLYTLHIPTTCICPPVAFWEFRSQKKLIWLKQLILFVSFVMKMSPLTLDRSFSSSAVLTISFTLSVVICSRCCVSHWSSNPQILSWLTKLHYCGDPRATANMNQTEAAIFRTLCSMSAQQWYSLVLLVGRHLNMEKLIYTVRLGPHLS